MLLPAATGRTSRDAAAGTLTWSAYRAYMKRVWIAALSLVLGSAAPALAHAAYESSDPDDGSSVSSPPSRVIADFTEPLTEGSMLAVYDSCGRQVDNRDSLVASDRLTVTMSGRYRGVYSVSFNVVSAVDSHNTKGTFTFTVTGGAPCPGEEPSEEESEQTSDGGGNNNPGSSSSSGSGGSNDSTSTSDSRGGGSDASRPSSEGGRPGQSGGRDGGQRKTDGGGDRFRQNNSGGEPLSAKVPNLNPASASGQAEEAAPSVWDGIPMGVFWVGLALSTVIGAAGGKIYAGIMGWRA